MRFILVCVLVLFCIVSLSAQVATGRITGRVTDPSSAVVPGASVKAVNLSTNVETSTKTSSEGVFDVRNLIPGQYRVEVEMGGFKHFEQGPMELRVADALTLNVTLQLGSQAETVTVNAEAPLIEASSASTGQVTDLKRIEYLPTPSSNPLFTMMLAANMTSLQNPVSTFTPDAGSQQNTAAAGTLQGQSGQSIDGVPAMQQGGGSGITPPPEVLQEVKVETAPYDASLGHFSGAMINMVTKSGTNAVHGSMAFWHTDTSLNALEYFAGRSINDPSTGPVTHEKIRGVVPYIGFNRYRGAVGGPVWVPKVYDGRNRTFWHYTVDKYYMPYSSNGYFTVPTPKERQGDFSELLALGSTYQIYDPYSAVATAGGHVARTPLTGNIVPPGKLSPVAQKLLRYYPLPNATGTNTGLNNFTGVPNSSIDMLQQFARLDEVLRDNNRVYVSYNRYCLAAIQNIRFGKPLGDIYPTGGYQNNCHEGGALSEVITPSAAWVLDFRYGISRTLNDGPSPTLGFDLSKLGMSQDVIRIVDPKQATLPATSIDNITGIGGGSGSTSSQTFHSFYASARHLSGVHSLNFGIDSRVQMMTNNSRGNLTPSYSFSSNWTKATDTSATSPMGQGLASFLYGLPTSGTISRNASSAITSKMFSWFVQDDWKVTRKLTVNMGIRHEMEFGTTERYNRANRGFDFVTPNPVQAVAKANYALNPISQIPAADFKVLGGQLFATTDQRAMYNMNPRNFMPRIGLAYQLNPATVLRAGYGIYFETFAVDFVGVTQNGYSQSTTMVPSVDNGLTLRVNLENNPFPDGILTPTGASTGLKTFLGRSISFTNTNIKQAYAQRWSFNIQRQFRQRFLVEVGYMGNRGTRIRTSNAWNSLPLKYLSQSPFRDQATINTLGANVANPFYGIADFATTGLANATVGVSQLLLPFPQFTGVTSTDGSGFSWYHALSLRAEKRLSQGFTVQADYTWSKFMEADSRMNGIEDYIQHTISASDRPQQLTVNGIYELPFGKGKHFVPSLPGWADRVVGGWQAAAIYIAQTGPPMAFGNVIFLGNLHDIVLPKSERTLQRYFNTGAGFNTVSAQQLASNYRTFPARLTGARNPGWNFWSMSVIKAIRLHEKLDFEVRGEAKNALNHPNWAGPSLTPTNSLFGTITGSGGARQITLQGKLIW